MCPIARRLTSSGLDTHWAVECYRSERRERLENLFKTNRKMVDDFDCVRLMLEVNDTSATQTSAWYVVIVRTSVSCMPSYSLQPCSKLVLLMCSLDRSGTFHRRWVKPPVSLFLHMFLLLTHKMFLFPIHKEEAKFKRGRSCVRSSVNCIRMSFLRLGPSNREHEITTLTMGLPNEFFDTLTP